MRNKITITFLISVFYKIHPSIFYSHFQYQYQLVISHFKSLFFAFLFQSLSSFWGVVL